MQVNQTKTVPVEAKEIRLHLKVCDRFTASLHDQDGCEIGERDDYVPDFFPGDHYGDYVILNIDVDSGKVTNWNTPKADTLQEAFGMNAPEEE